MLTVNFIRIFLASVIFSLCKADSIVDRLPKCTIKDNVCLAKLYNLIFKELADNGLPEYGLPRIDPFNIENTEIIALGLIKVTLKEGVAKGAKSCVLKDFDTNVEAKQVRVKITCDKVEVEGKYTLGTTPALEAFVGKLDIHGNGDVKIAVEKINLNVDFGVEVKKLDDGEIYFGLVPDDTTYTFRVLGDIVIQFTNLLVGKQDISAVTSTILSENKEFSVNAFGRTIGDKILEIIYKEFGIFNTKVPANKLVTDDLSAYVG